jgi:protein tyrosine phosphatase
MNNGNLNIIGIQVKDSNEIFICKYIIFYLAWPDQSCPDISQPLIELVKKVDKSRTELSNINKHSGPVVVHCRYIETLFLN